MVPEKEKVLPLSNSLATIEQLSTSSSSLDGLPSDLEASIRYAGLQITQAAGILLELSQDIVVQAMVLFTRFYLGPEGGSFRVNSAKDISAASIYMAAKLSADPQSPRAVCNVFAYLISKPVRKTFPIPPTDDPESYYLSEGAYHSARSVLLQTEIIILRTLGFDVKVIVPHHLALTYLQTLGVLPSTPSSVSRALAARTLGYLNLALFSPQLLYLTNQPTALAVAAIYLASREVGAKLPGIEWWEIFDVEREDLGFLVVAFRSCEAWMKAEKEKWLNQSCPLTVEEVDRAIQNI
ncbi:MAG: hypothetical protein Q9216_003858 [Gyalolechia sp. 2 TL-2023]